MFFYFFTIVPSEPVNLRASNLSSQVLNISWDTPEHWNGIITSYKVYYRLIRNDKNTPEENAVWRVNITSKRAIVLSKLGKFSRTL